MALFLLGVGYKKILHFLRLDSRELIQANFFDRSNSCSPQTNQATLIFDSGCQGNEGLVG
ncbi:hypothetical protein AOH269_06700 [Helicobacter pylori]